jgi:hypothetical protein
MAPWQSPRKRWTLEDRLPQVLLELETLAEEEERRRLARERERAERERAWEVAMTAARKRAIEHHRVEVLQKRVRAWEEAEQIRAYCDAVERRHGDAVVSDLEAESWLMVARERADRLQGVPRMPPDPEVKERDLEPFLDGWSAYGPRGGRW